MGFVPFFDRGGAVAFVTLPGGLELGKAWRNSGKHLQKKNVFDDFAAAAKHLINLGYTNPDKLAMGGASNGGLLVGATMNLYPELFRVAVPEFGVMDLVDFQKFTGGKWWMEDYGDTLIKTDFFNQLRLSPFHNLRHRKYPATFVTTGNFDDRVVPSHSYRYAARLQEMQRSDRPVLLHTVMGSSHGSGANAKEALRYITNKWTFILSELGVTR
jgi:prolyl oligopeptidase